VYGEVDLSGVEYVTAMLGGGTWISCSLIQASRRYT